MPRMSTPTSAGWYEDPEDADQLRYFDGVVWTAHRTARRVERPAPRPEPTTPPAAAPWPPGPGPSAGPPGAPAPVDRRHATGSGHRAGLAHDGDVLAEWWQRLVGRLVDAVLTGIVGGLLSLPFLGPVVEAFETVFARALTDPTPDAGVITTALLEAAVPVTLVGVGVGLVYETLFLVWKAATPGKMLVGTRVRPVAAAGPVGVGVALRRQGLPVASDLMGLVPVLGVLGTVLSVLDPAWLLWDPRRQALHDKVADTVVVKSR